MNMPRIVVCADDAGFCAESDAAILACVRAGNVTAVSVAVTGDTWRDVLPELCRESVDIGLHLSLTEGRAVSGPVPGLTDATRVFQRSKSDAMRALQEGEIDSDAIENEVHAQWRALSDHADPVFLNGHNHIHTLLPVSRALRGLDRKDLLWFRVPVPTNDTPDPFRTCIEAPEIDALRTLGRSTEAFLGWTFAREPSLATLEYECQHAVRATNEFMCHPGNRPGSSFTTGPARQAESDVLCGRDIQSCLNAMGVSLASFSELA